VYGGHVYTLDKFSEVSKWGQARQTNGGQALQKNGGQVYILNNLRWARFL